MALLDGAGIDHDLEGFSPVALPVGNAVDERVVVRDDLADAADGLVEAILIDGILEL
ncbi:hypothetical protein [Adlercreutzia muris]|uniref:hypothetical protein n=1 Tax=Adlercreutzia muris TaxID=1796610 RepID=UPI003B96928F